MSLGSIPYDIVVNISKFLDPIGLVHLRNSCKYLYEICTDNYLSKVVLLHHVPWALETTIARRDGKGEWTKALQRFYCRKMAVSRGTPASVKELSLAYDMVFDNGVIAFVGKQSIVVRDLVFGGNVLIPFTSLEGSPQNASDLRIIHFCKGVLSILFYQADGLTDVLLAVDTFLLSGKFKNLLSVQLENSNRVFVRNDEKYLYYGVYLRTGETRDKVWEIRGVSLRLSPFPLEARSQKENAKSWESTLISLKDFTGSELGSTVAFEIHNGYFYAVTNRDDEDCIEVDWTSFYTCFKFPLGNPGNLPGLRKCNNDIYRRQHLEGPIHSSLTHLALQTDERTNDLMIVESRTEWLNGSGRQQRTVYLQEIEFPEAGEDTTQNLLGFRKGVGPDGDICSDLALPCSRYADEQPREPWQVHPEEINRLVPVETSSVDPWDEFPHKEFAERSQLSKKCFLVQDTRFQSYDLSTGTILDVVFDNRCCTEHAYDAQKSCIRIRSASRQLAPQNLEHGNVKLGKKRAVDCLGCNNSSAIQYGSELTSQDVLSATYKNYKYSPLTLWPPPPSTSSYAAKMHETLNYESFNALRSKGMPTVKVMSDERTIVLLVKEEESQASGKLIVLSFDKEAWISKEPQHRIMPNKKTVGGRARSSMRGLATSSPQTPATQHTQDKSGTENDLFVLNAESQFFEKILVPNIEKLGLDFGDPHWRFS